MARLENWTLHAAKGSDGKPFQYLTGIVYGHPKADWIRSVLIDEHMIRTSHISVSDFENNTVTTLSGTVYELGAKED